MQLSLEALFVIGLSTYRLAYMLVKEDGLFDVFDHLRRIGNRIGLGELFACIYCMSVWVSALLLLLWQHPAGQAINYIFALSAIAILLHEGVSRLKYRDERSKTNDNNKNPHLSG